MEAGGSRLPGQPGLPEIVSNKQKDERKDIEAGTWRELHTENYP